MNRIMKNYNIKDIKKFIEYIEYINNNLTNIFIKFKSSDILTKKIVEFYAEHNNIPINTDKQYNDTYKKIDRLLDRINSISKKNKNKKLYLGLIRNNHWIDLRF